MRPMKLLLLPAAALAATLAFGPGVAHANGNAPAGNNGTIKIDGVPAEDGNDNKPHPGCQFTVEFFGYDAGEYPAPERAQARPDSRLDRLVDLLVNGKISAEEFRVFKDRLDERPHDTD